MEQAKTLEMARRGDPLAIATLMNRSLKPKGITITIQRQQDLLRITLEATQIPEQHTLMPFVRSRINSLGMQSLRRVQVQGRQQGTEAAAWIEEFPLQPLSSTQGTWPTTAQRAPARLTDFPVTSISATSLVHSGSSSSQTDVRRLRLVFIGGTILSLAVVILIQLLFVDSGALSLRPAKNPLVLIFSFVCLLGNLGPLGFLISFILALIPAMIALDKGRDFSLWWLYGLHLWLVAIAHALLLRPLPPVQMQPNPEQQLRVCPHCGEINRGTATSCRHCDRDLTAATPQSGSHQGPKPG